MCVAVPEAILPIVASVEPSYLTASLADDGHGRICAAAAKQIETLLTGQTSVAIGPGWGRSSALTELGSWLFQSVPQPMVVDADALNALAEARRSLREHAGPRMLTPHPGEFARLLNVSTADVAKSREELAARFARDNGLVVVLKGHRSVITDGQRIAINKTGNSGMATGGTGDVLTGLIAALLAQGMEIFEAAHLGAHLHGLAGDIAAKNLSPRGLIASDVAAYLPKAWQRVVE